MRTTSLQNQENDNATPQIKCHACKVQRTKQSPALNGRFFLLQTNSSAYSLLLSLSLSLDSFSPRLHTLPQLIQQRNSLLHRNTSIRHRDTVLQSGRSLGRNILSTFKDVGLNHDTDNGVGCGSRGKLGGNVGTDLNLVEVLFGGVTVRAVNLFACFSHVFLNQKGRLGNVP